MQKRHWSSDETLPDRPPRPTITMQVDDCIRLVSIDTETGEHIIHYVDGDGTVVMTQTVNARTWALYESPFARRRSPLHI